MANLAIKGHVTRGSEVIELLEMLGGINKYNLRGSEDEWFVLNGTLIQRSDRLFAEKGFPLEQFLEKFPYKVGDKVKLDYWPCTIQSMEWDEYKNTILYTVRGFDFCKCVYSEDIQPYKEETIEGKDIINHTTEINLNHPCFEKCNEIELIIPDDWEFKRKGNKMFGVRKQYPKTYEECCKVLSLGEDGRLYTKGYKASLIQNFQKLLICRDAYWKIAGEQMGLGKPWEPSKDEECYCLSHYRGKIFKGKDYGEYYVLEFPSAEMRDAFKENFDKDIDLCKEFL